MMKHLIKNKVIKMNTNKHAISDVEFMIEFEFDKYPDDSLHDTLEGFKSISELCEALKLWLKDTGAWYNAGGFTITIDTDDTDDTDLDLCWDYYTKRNGRIEFDWDKIVSKLTKWLNDYIVQ